MRLFLIVHSLQLLIPLQDGTQINRKSFAANLQYRVVRFMALTEKSPEYSADENIDFSSII